MKAKRMQRYAVIGVFNERENGKTTFMVKDVVSKVHGGMYDKAYFNIHVGPKVDPKGLHYGDPKIEYINYEGMMKLELPTVRGLPRAILGLDQISNYFDARRSNTKKNTDFSKYVRELRQHGLDLEYTTWMRSELDKRLRPFTNLVVSAVRSPTGFVYEMLDRDRHIAYEPVEMKWPQAEKTWKWFDSTELIKDPTIPE